MKQGLQSCNPALWRKRGVQAEGKIGERLLSFSSAAMIKRQSLRSIFPEARRGAGP